MTQDIQSALNHLAFMAGRGVTGAEHEREKTREAISTIEAYVRNNCVPELPFATESKTTTAPDQIVPSCCPDESVGGTAEFHADNLKKWAKLLDLTDAPEAVDYIRLAADFIRQQDAVICLLKKTLQNFAPEEESPFIMECKIDMAKEAISAAKEQGYE